MKSLIKENPVFIMALGLCPALAITTTFEQAYMMGICVVIVLLFTNFIISLIKKVVPDSVQIPVYILIIGTIVTIIGLLLEKYVPNLYTSFGIYLSILTVNCIILGRALSYASKNSVVKSIKDALKVGIGYLFALIIIAFIRELLGSNTLTLMSEISSITGYRLIFKNILPTSLFPMAIFITPTGAFITIGVLIAVFNSIRRKHESN